MLKWCQSVHSNRISGKIFPNLQGRTMRIYPSLWSLFFFSYYNMQKWKRGLPIAAERKSNKSEEPSFIQSNPETEMRETTAEQKRSAYLRACTQNASTNDKLGYLKGQESPDIPLLILHIIEHMTQLRWRKYSVLSRGQWEWGNHQTPQAPPELRL